MDGKLQEEVSNRLVWDLAPLADGDAPALARALAGMDPWRTLGYSEAGLSAYLTREDPHLERRAVRVAGRLAGVVCVRHPWLRGPYVELLAVLPSDQGRGLGRAVLSRIEGDPRWAAGNLWLTVSDFNERAREFYGKQGFEEAATLSGLVAGGGAELLMRKRLGEKT